MGEHLSEKYQHLPIDTKYFKDLELEILSQFEDLDKALDGWLIKSENYQALNTILPKFKEKVQTIYIDPPFNTGDDFEYVDRFQDSTWLSLIYDRLKSAKYLLLNNGSIFLHLDRNADYYGRFLLQDIFESNSYKNDIIWKYFVSGKYPNEFAKDHDRILFYAKTPNSLFNYEKEIDSDLYYEKKAKGETVIKDGVEYYVYNGELRTFEKQIGETWNINKVKRDGRETFGFNTQKPEDLLKRIVKVSSQDGSIVLDYFLGIGTTIAVAHKMRRKWIGIEIADHFNTMYIDQTGAKKIGIVGRMKEVLAGQGNHEPCGISKEVNWQGGGFFKYYELEQYEESLNNCKYEDGGLFTVPGRSQYQEYVFMKDEKMLKALEIDYENDKVNVDLSQIYPNIDIAETLSNLTGKWIKKITPCLPEADTPLQEENNTPSANADTPLREGNYEVEFEDGTKINTKDLDYKLIKPLIWWE
jgi:adenine specific DNA methylase Mod